jgi:hypothetical protein
MAGSIFDNLPRQGELDLSGFQWVTFPAPALMNRTGKGGPLP